MHEEDAPKKRRRRFNGDMGVDSQGQSVEYEHGYLRHKIKEERGVLKRRQQRSPAFNPQIVEDCGVEILYLLELEALPASMTGSLPIELWWRNAGNPAAPLQPLAPSGETTLPSSEDAALLKALMPHRETTPGCRGNRFLLPPDAQPRFVRLAEDAGQLRWSARGQERPWRLHRLGYGGKCDWCASWERDEAHDRMRPRVWIATPQGDLAIESWQAFSPSGWAVANDTLWILNVKNAGMRLASLTGRQPPWMTRREALAFTELLTLDGTADLSQMQDAERVPTEMGMPIGRLYIETARYKHLGQEQLQATLSFQYAPEVFCDEASTEERLQGIHEVIQRNPDEEERLREELLRTGFRNVTRTGGDEDPGWKLLPAKLDQAVRTLVLRGWHIRAQGKSYRRPVEKNFTIRTSGIDWMDLDAEIAFDDGQRLETPELLKALRTGAKSVRLDDGTYGILPNEWLEKFTALVEIGETDSARVRIRQEQAALLDAILQEQVEDVDGRYGAVLDKLRQRAADTPQKCDPPEWFAARLRPYQKDAVNWLAQMEGLGLSGILADDMGLGKTVQVLALLARRHEEGPLLPTLVVMPSSLLFNWQDEAARFAPRLKTHIHHGASRGDATPEAFAGFDLVFTTYGTLRQDIVALSRIPFDYVVLDESQAIKNSDSATALAARALRANHRLAMTGTPVENNISELLSQLSFLNPGLFRLGFVKSFSHGTALATDRETLARLRKAVAPFIMRRRKEEVATDLPPKTEQVLMCSLHDAQREQYEQLRDYYRKEFSATSGTSTVNMLAALLRLRQAACHPALVNESFSETESAKVTLLHSMLEELIQSGHKALVFSQFIAFLNLIEKDLDDAGWNYCHLDGETKNRGEVVKEFQDNPDKKVFLISLKAGGVGLNLTAADYVFIMDPWWNPAAEAQAVDRTYRIGQQRPVFAYRIIAEGTVEEKVLQMQTQKRRIANTLLDSFTAIPAEITQEELRSLLENM